jgi:hypothetical protein
MVLLLFALWAFISLWNQGAIVKALAERRRFSLIQWDIFALIPFWAFWSISTNRDAVLLYRDKYIDGSLTPWRNAWAVYPNCFSFIWSPQLRKWKALEQWYFLLASVAEGKKTPTELFLSRAYISAALHVSGLRSVAETEFRQFMIARVAGFDSDEPPEIMFVSPLFLLKGSL